MYSTPYYYYDYSSADIADAAFSMVAGGLLVFMFFILFFALLISIIQIIAMWKIFSKAGEKGWKSLIPIYNMIVLFQISGLSPWLILLYLASWIPYVGWIIPIALTIYLDCKLAKAFGKSSGFTVGLILLPSIFYLILGFGKSEYVGTQEN